MKFWTGIGSRETPKNILSLMEDIAFKLSQDKWILRSGGAEGADTAFENGALSSFTEVVPEIYLPWLTFNNHDCMSKGILLPSKWHNWDNAQKIASTIHPAWDNLSSAGKTLHSRNCYQVLGRDFRTPSKFLICWAKPTKSGEVSGGTRTAVVLALTNNVPIFNLWCHKVVERFNKYLEE